MNEKPIVFFSSDKNTFYSDFSPYVIEAWESFGFEVNYCIIDENNYFVEPDIIPFGNQAQICRVLLPALYPDRICLTSDIDMLPLSRNYFLSSLQQINKNDKNVILSLSSDAYNSWVKSYKRHPICYLAGFGEAFSVVSKVKSKKEISSVMLEWWNEKHGWNTDEICFSMNLYNAIKSNEIILKENLRGWNNGIANFRIDRDKWNYDYHKLLNNHYIDSHMLRPLQKYKNELKPLFDFILSSNKKY
ncbi:MAG: hypothetical protein JSV62_04895 [Promethearchaeota archaeon]|nr:MAG: hypothetical protein JSV62_04895 [Candidatus Lokiarchaeota archaeon]